MKQNYFVVVLAHSVHGRLRRIHVPHHALYVVVALALFGSVSLFGMVSSYLRMVGKVANYNSLGIRSIPSAASTGLCRGRTTRTGNTWRRWR